MCIDCAPNRVVRLHLSIKLNMITMLKMYLHVNIFNMHAKMECKLANSLYSL